ncbi:synaptic functional regulator FMR1-like [Xenopus laevis]|uniref:Synaptic functional regulator FMR1-like n=2 Tax=Xenopus laevis TaxID=8355 RepID=A0A1L8FMG2_XENLA|nr:synaptic functional regulator FMR1-like [Xenopus laevis]OCT72792.1 hypothetical protein XELAEV_18035775mg [Xenopus laevis]
MLGTMGRSMAGKEVPYILPMIKGMPQINMDELEEEVRGTNGAYYKAFVRDIHKNAITIAVENSWQAEKRIPFQDVRFPPSSTYCRETDVGGVIEVYTRINKKEPRSCWLAKVLERKKENAVVAFTDYDNHYAKNITLTRVNPNKAADKYSFHKVTLDVPADLQKVCAEEVLLQDFRRAVGAFSIRYDWVSSQIIILSSNEFTRKWVNMLKDNLFHSFRIKQYLKVGKQNASKKLEKFSARFHEQVKVKQHLIGLAIGKKGANIEEAKKIPGVISIDLDPENHTFHIYANSREAVSKAKAYMEYKEKVLQVQKTLVDKAFSKSKNFIGVIAQKTGVVGIHAEDELYLFSEGHQVNFIILGRKDNVAAAYVLLECHLNDINFLKPLRVGSLQIDQPLQQNSVCPTPQANHCDTEEGSGELSVHEAESDHEAELLDWSAAPFEEEDICL